MMSVTRVTSTSVPGLQSLPGGGKLIITPNITQQQRQQLTQALLQVYTTGNGGSSSSSQSVGQTLPEPQRQAPAGKSPKAPGFALADLIKAAGMARAAGLARAAALGNAGAAAERPAKRARQEPEVQVQQEPQQAGRDGQASSMQLFIKTMTGRTLTVSVGRDDTVLEVKEWLYRAGAGNVEDMILLFAGKQLEDDKTLRQYGVSRECTLHLVSRLRGC